jgi:hypothetical protein
MRKPKFAVGDKALAYHGQQLYEAKVCAFLLNAISSSNKQKVHVFCSGVGD